MPNTSKSAHETSSYEKTICGFIFLCDSSENSACWLNKCNAYCNAKKFLPMLELAAIMNYKQLPNVYVKKQDKTVRVKMNFTQN